MIQQLGRVDRNQLEEKKNRFRKSNGQEKELLQAEIKREEERIIVEETVVELESRLVMNIQEFDRRIAMIVEFLRGSQNPGDAMPFFTRARRVLRDIRTIDMGLQDLERRMVSLLKEERRLLTEESQTA